MRNGPGKISEPGREKDEERMKNEEDSLAQSDRCKIVNKGIRPPFVYPCRESRNSFAGPFALLIHAQGPHCSQNGSIVSTSDISEKCSETACMCVCVHDSVDTDSPRAV